MSKFLPILAILVIISPTYSEILRRCIACRSRGELGVCKDKFKFNNTAVENERGLKAVPCSSGWCAKIIESQSDFVEEYGVATQRFCLQRGPSDGEDRCSYTKWQHKNVLMCFCYGDLCNASVTSSVNYAMISTAIFVIFLIRINF